MTNPAPDTETPSSLPPSAPRMAITPRWWLPTALGVSAVLHVLLFANLGRFLSVPPPEPVALLPPASVTVDLRSRSDSAPPSQPAPVAAPVEAPTPRQDAAPVAPDTPDVPVSRPTPVTKTAPTPRIKPAHPVAPQTAPVTPQTAPVAEPEKVQPTPQMQPRPVPTQAPVASVETITMRPTARPNPQATSGILPNRLEVPLPQGELDADPNLDRQPRRLSPITATPSPLPQIDRNAPEGRGGGTEIASARPSVPNAPATIPATGDVAAAGGKGGGEGGGEGPNSGAGSGNGSGSGLGINRGIPFGDKNGLANGDPRGGGGTGGGPGGGRPRFTLARRSGGGAPVHVIYVLDISGSMADGDKIDSAQDALRKALGELRPEDSFNIVLFAGDARAAYPTLKPASAFYVSNGETQIDLARPRGATNMSAAMEMALQQEGATHVFLLADGEPTEGITDPAELRAMIRQRNRGRMRIITMALGIGETSEGFALLKAIADENGGAFSYINLAKK